MKFASPEVATKYERGVNNTYSFSNGESRKNMRFMQMRLHAESIRVANGKRDS